MQLAVTWLPEVADAKCMASIDISEQGMERLQLRFLVLNCLRLSVGAVIIP